MVVARFYSLSEESWIREPEWVSDQSCVTLFEEIWISDKRTRMSLGWIIVWLLFLWRVPDMNESQNESLMNHGDIWHIPFFALYTPTHLTSSGYLFLWKLATTAPSLLECSWHFPRECGMCVSHRLHNLWWLIKLIVEVLYLWVLSPLRGSALPCSCKGVYLCCWTSLHHPTGSSRLTSDTYQRILHSIKSPLKKKNSLLCSNFSCSL